MRAADELMHDQGYHAVGVADICARADTKKGSFYHFFDSKQALTVAMLDAAWLRTRRTIFAAAFDDPSRCTLDSFDAYGDTLADHLVRLANERGSVSGCKFGNLANECAATDAAIGRCIGDIFESMIDVFTSTIVRGQASGEIAVDLDPHQAATRLLALMEGLMTVAKATNDPELLRDLGPTARRILTGDTL